MRYVHEMSTIDTQLIMSTRGVFVPNLVKSVHWGLLGKGGEI